MKAPTTYTHTFRLPVAPTAAFELFSDPRRLDALTPPWFRLNPRAATPAELAAGSVISYRFRWRGLPLPWTSRITEWQAPDFFAYEQVRGPFRYFRHEHSFDPVDGGTLVRDQALFATAGGGLFDRRLVVPDLRRIFLYRESASRALLARHQAGDAASGGAHRMPCTSATSSAIERPT